MSLTTRVIARLDVKPSLGVVKGRRLDGLRCVADPATMMRALDGGDATQDADEIIWLDITASLYGRPFEVAFFRSLNQGYLPVTVGGGIRSYRDFHAAIRWAAEKACINTAALREPNLITECAKSFGSQAVVVEIQTKRRN